MMLFLSEEANNDSRTISVPKGRKGDERGGILVCIMRLVKFSGTDSVARASLSVPLVPVSHSPSSVSIGLPSLDTANGF